MKNGFFIIVFIFSLFSCNKNDPHKDKREVNISFLSSVRSLDPRISNEYPSCHIINMIYEGLMRLGPDGAITPGVAASYTISEDHKTYTFHLRDSTWSNGDPVTAYDFEYAWKKSVNPLHAKTGAYTFYVIKNVSACLEKKVGVEDVGIRALDQKTLEVELEHPAPYFLSLCACSTYSPIHKNFDKSDPKWASNVNEHLVFNGPFIVAEWRKGVEVHLKKNPTYWDAETVKIPGIKVQMIEDGNTQYSLFEKGELDWIGEPLNPLPFDIIADCHQKEKLKVIDAYGLYWFFVNTEAPPFNNKNLRKAFAYALNRKEISDHVFQLGETPALGILSKGLAVQDTPYFEDGNTALAQKCFAEALKEMNLSLENLPTITLSQRAGNLCTNRMVQAVQDQLRKVLGVKIKIDQADFPTHFTRMSKGDYEFGEMGWNSWLKDPIYMLNTFRNRSLATNMSRWEDSRYQELLDLSDSEVDPVKRNEYLSQAEELLMEEMPVIPLCYTRLHYLHNPKLKGVYVSPLKELDLRYAYFEQ